METVTNGHHYRRAYTASERSELCTEPLGVVCPCISAIAAAALNELPGQVLLAKVSLFGMMPLRVLMLALLALICCSGTSAEARTDAACRFHRFTKALAACEPRGTLARSWHLECIIGQVGFR